MLGGSKSEARKKVTTTNIHNYDPSKSKRFFLLVAIGFVFLAAVAFGLSQTLLKNRNVISGVIGSNNFIKSLNPQASYLAVFLSNGQTYFGRLDPDDLNGNYVVLSEVYYLENAPAGNTAGGKTSTTSATPGYNLIHLGNELHGPTDQMIINRTNILFIEQLKSDSKVVAAIASSQR